MKKLSIIFLLFITHSLLFIANAQELWTPTTTVNAPTARAQHMAVWTGAKLIVWGGGNGSIIKDFTN